MDFNEKFRKKLETKLRELKFVLEKDCYDLLSVIPKANYRVLLEMDPASFRLDVDGKRKMIGEAIKNPNNPTLQIRKMPFLSFLLNEVKFDLIQIYPEPDWGSEAHVAFRNKRDQLEYDCMDEYWANQVVRQSYQEISNFSCFIDEIKPIADLEHEKRAGKLIFNIKGWLNYIRLVVAGSFSQFNFNKSLSNSKIVRFLKPINDDVFFGFEYNEDLLKKDFQKGDASLPQYLRLILVSKEFDRQLQEKDYVQFNNNTIISLGILGNPFFFPPCYPLSGFSVIDFSRHKYQIKHKILNDSSFQIIHSEAYGESLKKYAYYYMDVLRYSSASYLEYLEKSIKGSL